MLYVSIRTVVPMILHMSIVFILYRAGAVALFSSVLPRFKKPYRSFFSTSAGPTTPRTMGSGNVFFRGPILLFITTAALTQVALGDTLTSTRQFTSRWPPSNPWEPRYKQNPSFGNGPGRRGQPNRSGGNPRGRETRPNRPFGNPPGRPAQANRPFQNTQARRGEPCTPWTQCKAPLECRQGLCKRPVSRNGRCWKGNSFCPPGTECGPNGRCTQSVPLGDSCGGGRVCDSGLSCDFFRRTNRQCVRRVTRRETCSADSFSVCEAGLQCIGSRHQCFRKAPDQFTGFISFNRRRFVEDRIIVDEVCPTSDVRTYSGFCNNKKHPTWGAANTTFSSKSPVARHFKMPNARRISNMICKENGPAKPNSRGMTELVTFFGQFIDHTITFTDNSKVHDDITVPPGDVFTANKIPFFRTQKREGMPINFMSSYIDGANVYGRTDDIALEIRAHEGGRLRLYNGYMPRESSGRRSPFVAGDSRANENPVLTALHTIFVREHNRLCEEIDVALGPMSDDEIYELARSIVVAQMQAIVYYEWLPAVLGRELPRYRGYNQNIKASVSNEFSTAAFRVGHTMVNGKLTMIDRTGTKRRQSPLRDAFFNPDFFIDVGPEALLRGVTNTAAAAIDAKISDDLRVALVGEHEQQKGTQLDLAALNIQRARDNGVPSFNELCKAYRVPQAFSFADITGEHNADAAALEQLYSSVDQVDAWIGGLCQPRSAGSLGSLFTKIWEDEFTRLRDGDRFYFEKFNVFKKRHINKIRTLRHLVKSRNAIGKVMTNIIVRNTDIRKREMPRDPFMLY